MGSIVHLGRIGLEHDAFEELNTARVAIPETNGLVAGSRVLLRGVEVGHVTAVHSSATGIAVDWNYDRGVRIPAESRFRIDNLSALGETYLSVLPSSSAGPYLADGAQVPADQVQVPTTFDELSQRLTVLLEQVEPEQIRAIFATVDTALPEDPWVLNDLNRVGELLASMLVQQSSNLTSVLTAVQPLLRQSGTVPADLAATSPIIEDFGAGFHEVLGAIHFVSSFAPLNDGIKYGAGPLFDELQTFLHDTAADLHTLGTELLPGVQAGGAALSTVNIGQLLDNALAATGTGDAVTVHLDLPGR
ncbi:MlaD family protein [Nocardia sp. NPDC057227]|uniref:MlaD family protein n=1 Tax=Nocardia sp. NPDC057227 TaxID=3346056 RepID=UPI003639208E